ncbi:MAG TPA: hypothetical protein VJ622_10930, partial [Acidimicrobiia bacterium]|nr:hypothetical protein [Acidimicrobiia bacterium]
QSPRRRRLGSRPRRLAVLAAVVLAGLVPLSAAPVPVPALADAPAGAGFSGPGYWLVASDGGIFSFGGARFLGSTGAIHLNQPIVGMAATPTGQGYWLVASDGGIFAFGDARFFGSTGAIRLARPITGMATTPGGAGYWLTASDGGVFAFGDAAYKGAAPERAARGDRQIVAMVPSATGGGYWQAGASGELLAFGDAPYFGGAESPSRPIVGMAAVAGGADNLVIDNPPGDGPTTTTTAPAPFTGTPTIFSSTAAVAWGTPDQTIVDPEHPGRHILDKRGKPNYAQEVEALAEWNGRVYLGGIFTNIIDPNRNPASPPQPILTVFDPATGAPIPGSVFNANATAGYDPASHDVVHALAVDAAHHRLIVGGIFSQMGGQKVRNLAAVDLETGLLDPTFQPPTPDDGVKSLALAGDRLYVGGNFLNVQTPGGLVPRSQLMALDAATGALIDSFVPPTNYGGAFVGHTGAPTEDPTLDGLPYAIAVPADGQTVWVGGDFLHWGTQPANDTKHQHGGLIVLDASTGALTPWQPVEKYPVFDLTVWPGDGKTVFAATGGPGGSVQSYLMNATPTKGTSPQWTGRTDGDATGVVATTERVYLVGHYDHYVPDPNDPCLKLTPQPNGQMGISCPAGSPNRHLAAFYARGGTDANGKPNGLAQVDPTFTAQADTPEGPSTALIGAHYLYIGGNFQLVSDTPGANFRRQPGFAEFPAIG